MEKKDSISLLASHIFACAFEKNYNCITSNTIFDENGFYLDIKFNDETNISTNDFGKITKLVEKITTGALKIEYINKSISDFNKEFKNNKYQLHYVNDTFQPSQKDVTLIKIGDYLGVCENLEYSNTNILKAFKIISVGGSYWLGNSDNEQLIRLRGIACESKSELEVLINEYNERIERDHRTIGKNLDLFGFDLLAGQGLPLWLPNGAIIKKEIRNYLSELEFKYGFENTFTPVLGNVKLYQKSGHWDHYKENMFPVMKVDHEELVLRPMTCPHHVLIYKRKPYSYKQLPLRLCEESMLHRYESSGGLTGLERVREMVLEDTHIFCTPEQLEDEVFNCYQLIKEAHDGLGSSIFQVDLSLHDPDDKEKYHHDEKMWSTAENTLRQMLKKYKIPFVEKKGEAAFYGPKIDFQVKTILGRIITMSTIQLDFLLPERFELTYKDMNGDEKQAIMIHLGMVGTYERLVSIILEQTKGILPLWLSPIQIIIIPVNNDIHLEYAKQLQKKLREKMVRCELNDKDDRMSKKIRDAQISKIPYQIIVGDEELKNKTISIRRYAEESTQSISIDKFIDLIINEIKIKK